MGRVITAVALFSFFLAPPAWAQTLDSFDGNFSESDWQAELSVRGLPNGTGNGSAMRVSSGGNPGAYWEIYLIREPDEAGPDVSSRMESFSLLPLSHSGQAGYEACFTGEIHSVDISIEGKQFSGGSGGTVGPTLEQNGVQYVAAGTPVPEQDFTEKTFSGLTANSFFPIGMPAVHPDFSVTGGPITFGFYYVISSSTGATVTRTGGFDNWELAINYTAPPPFFINAGLNDAWFNVLTAGQGFFFTVFPDLGAFFLAWFTYDTERPDDAIVANLGEPGHRWLTAFGYYEGDTVELDVELTSGGIFNSTEPAPLQEPAYGTISIVFHGCRCATLVYDFPSLGLMGEIPLRRIANDNVGRCETLNAELAGLEAGLQR